MTESNRVEYKRELTDSLEREAVAFLNYRDGGVIYIGINDDGTAAGVANSDMVQLAIKDRLKNNILPSCMGLFDVIHETRDGKGIIKIILAGGSEKPYYLKKFGMSEKGCFIRVGSASEPMPVRMIEDLFARRIRNSIGNMRSPRKDLTFEQLKIYYQEAGLALNDHFLPSLELLTPDGSLNYAAYLLADENGNSIKVAKYSGTDRVELTENSEYGYCSLVKAVSRVLEKMDVENRTYTKITPRKRLQREMIDPKALREAVINAVIHNDYSNGAVPKFEFFDDRLEITSMGGLPFGVSKEDFFSGLSVPRNKELMRVFRDLELVEQLGSGIPRILKKYDRKVFELSENYLRVTFHYQQPFEGAEPEKKMSEGGSMGGSIGGSMGGSIDLTERQQEVLSIIRSNNKISYRDIAQKLAINESAVKKHLDHLKEKGVLTRVGGTRGRWEIVGEDTP